MNKTVIIRNHTHSGAFGYCGNKGELLYNDDKFFVVKLTYANIKVFDKSKYFYDEIFVPPVPAGKYASLSVKGDRDASWHGEFSLIVSYEKRPDGYWFCFKHNYLGLVWHKVDSVDMVEIPDHIVQNFMNK